MNAPESISVVDGLMAATARVRNMTFVTRNTAGVARTGVRLLDRSIIPLDIVRSVRRAHDVLDRVSRSD